SFNCDIRDEERVKEVVAEVVERFGGIHGLVNSAGGQYKSPLEEISTKGFEAVVRNNLTGGFIFMREVFNGYMKEHGGSSSTSSPTSGTAGPASPTPEPSAAACSRCPNQQPASGRSTASGSTRWLRDRSPR